MNLLPPQELSLIQRAYHLRLLIVLLVLLLVALGITVVLLLPSYMKASTVKEDLERTKETYELRLERQGGNEARNFLNKTNERIVLIASMGEGYAMTDIISLLEDSQGTGIAFTGFIIQDKQQAETAPNVSVRGVADTRADLIAFIDTLNANERIEKAELPIGDLARSVAIPFTLAVVLKDE